MQSHSHEGRQACDATVCQRRAVVIALPICLGLLFFGIVAVIMGQTPSTATGSRTSAFELEGLAGLMVLTASCTRASRLSAVLEGSVPCQEKVAEGRLELRKAKLNWAEATVDNPNATKKARALAAETLVEIAAQDALEREQGNDEARSLGMYR